MKFSVRLTKVGLFAFIFVISILTVALSVRSPALLALDAFLSTVFLLSFVLALWNVLPVKVSSLLKTLSLSPGKGVLPLKVSRPWGSSYALRICSPAGETTVDKLKGQKKVIFPLQRPEAGLNPVILKADYPLQFFVVERILPDLKVEILASDSPHEKAWDHISELNEYQGREPWSRVDWKAWARHQRLLVRQPERDDAPFCQKASWFRKDKDAEKPSLLAAGLLAYVSILWTALPFLLKLPYLWAIGIVVFFAYGLYRLWSGKRPLFSENIGVVLMSILFFLAPPGLSFAHLWDKLALLVLGLALVKGLSPFKAYDILQLYVLSLLLLILYLAIGKPPFWALILPVTFLILLGAFLLQFGTLRRLPRFSLSFLYVGALLVAWTTFSLGSAVFPPVPQSGVSNFFDLREAQRLTLSPHVVGRLRFIKGGVSSPLYLRVFSYNHYYHGFWMKDETPFSCAPGPVFTYSLELKESMSGLPYLGCPKEIEGPVAWKAQGQFSPAKKGRYLVSAYEGLPQGNPQEFLKVPPVLKAPLRKIARNLQGEDVEETLRRVKSFFSSFEYTLSPGPSEGDPVLYFLQKRRAGFCEHFASAAVLLLRTMGIPARVISGFVLGPKPLWGRYYPISASGAHAWVEVWDGQKWRIYDPSPVVFRAEAYWSIWFDSFDYLLETAGFFLLKILLVLGGIGFLFYRVYHSCQRRKDPVSDLLNFLAQKGLPKSPRETMAEYTARLEAKFPSLGKDLQQFLELYHEVVFGEKGSSERLHQEVRKLKALLGREIAKSRPHPSG